MMPVAVGRVAQRHGDLPTLHATFDEHVTLGATGRCAACGEEGPCARQRLANRLLLESGSLPRRRPGATRPEQIGQSSGGGSWFSR